jgi:hypothetical protein
MYFQLLSHRDNPWKLALVIRTILPIFLRDFLVSAAQLLIRSEQGGECCSESSVGGRAG